MIDSKLLYIALMALAFAGPFFLSFDKKVAFYKYWVPLFKAILPVTLVFILWDIAFTHFGIWGFNDRYISGVSLAGLPLGEYLFFIVIPYCCLFIYQVLIAYVPTGGLARFSPAISNFLMGFAGCMAIIFYDHLYSLVTFILVTVVVFYFSRIGRAPWLGRFYLAYIIILFPFIVINGILTGSFLQEEVVWYKAEEIVGIRIGTIPLEDFFYGMILILLVTALFEHFKGRAQLQDRP